MKKIIALILALTFALGLSACGDTKNVQIKECSSEVYSDTEIRNAINVSIDYFKRAFDGCTLIEISYLGDDKLDDWQEFADRNNADDVIVLVSSFKVDDSGASPSLNPNSTYTNWKWVLVRDNGGRWRHVDHGY